MTLQNIYHALEYIFKYELISSYKIYTINFFQRFLSVMMSHSQLPSDENIISAFELFLKTKRFSVTNKFDVLGFVNELWIIL